MATAVGGFVGLSELATECGGLERCQHFVRELKVPVGADWRGRPAVTAKDAARLVDAHRAEAARWALDEANFKTYLKQHDADVREAGEVVFRERLQAEHRREYDALFNAVPGRHVSVSSGALPPSPAAMHAASASAAAAREEYARRHPRLDWEEWRRKHGAA